MSKKNIKSTFKTLTLSLLIFSSGAFAMKKADFIKALNEQISLLEIERSVLLSTNATSTEYIILALEAEIAALISEKEKALASN